MKLLITAGATREPIDSVRFITNFSTGKTGALLADFMAESGHEVTYLAGIGAIRPHLVNDVETYESFEDLNELLKKHLASGKFDAVIHLAAVSDYSVKEVRTHKTSTGFSTPTRRGEKINSNQELEIILKPNFKIVEQLKSYSPKPLLVVAFKLTASKSDQEKIQAIEKLALNSQIDFVVHNDFLEMKEEQHPFWIYQKDKNIKAGQSKFEMAQSLHELLRSSL